MTNLKTILVCATCLTTALSAPVFAQESAMPQAAEDSRIDASEIVVTARKRQESILKVPVITNVLSSAMIERAAISDVTQVSTKTPGVVLGKSSLEIGTQISIRGVGTSQLDPGIDSSTSLNIDGLQLSQAMAFTVGLLDMQQIEVLKGPQALFFGKNSPAGVVSIRSKDPGDKFELMGRAGYEFYARAKEVEGVISGPVSDTLGLRFATRYRDSDGYFKNIAVGQAATGGVTPGKRARPVESFYMRGTMLFKPTSDFTARLKLNYTRDNQEGPPGTQNYSCPDGNASYTAFPFIGIDNCKFDRTQAVVNSDPSFFGNLLENNGVGFTNIRQKFGTLELNYDTSGMTLTSVTGYYKLKVNTQANGVQSQSAGPTLIANKHFRRRDVTQEFRVTSDWSSPFNITAGAFYQDGNITNDILITGNRAYGLPAILQAGVHDVDIKSVSAFAQGRYKVVPEFEIALGARYTDEKRSNASTVRAAATGIFNPVLLPKLRTKNWSPELTLTWTPTDDLTIFGSLKQGYKSGSYNLIVPSTGTNFFGDEKVQGGEIGLKTRFLDRQANANFAFYYYKYSGLQVGANEVAAGGLPIIRTINAGGAKVYGIDFDANYRPDSVPGLTFNVSANYNIAKFTSFGNAPCTGGQTIAEGCNRLLNPATGRFNGQDLGGFPLTRAPKLQAVISGDYEIPVSDSMSFILASDVQYSSKYLSALGNRQDFYMRKFAKLNAYFTLKANDDKWEVSLIGNNLTNIYRAGTCTSFNQAGGQILPGIVSGAAAKGPGGSDEVGCEPEEGRTVMIRLTFRPF